MGNFRTLRTLGTKSVIIASIGGLVLTLPMCTSLPNVSSSFSATAAMATTSQFSDLKNDHWAHGSVIALYQKGIISGYPDGTFKPTNTVTYGEYIKMVVEADSKDPVYFVNTGNRGTETGSGNNSNWAEEYYQTALAKNYCSANRITKKMLKHPIPRRDMALITSAVLGAVKIANYDEIQANIKDINSRTPDEYEITKAYATGVLNGYPDMTFKPDKTLTRAEAAASMERLILAVEGRQKAEDTISFSKDSEMGAVSFPEYLKVKDYPLIVKNSSVPVQNNTKLLKPIAELVNGDCSGTVLDNVKYYWVNENPPYEFKTWDNLVGTERLLFSVADNSRQVIFIINGNLINAFDSSGYMYGVQGLPAGSRLPKFDYIGMFTYGRDTMMVIKNPIL